MPFTNFLVFYMYISALQTVSYSDKFVRKADDVTKVDNRHPTEPVYVNLYSNWKSWFRPTWFFKATRVHAARQRPTKGLCYSVFSQDILYIQIWNF
jgi:hypothetical protein